MYLEVGKTKHLKKQKQTMSTTSLTQVSPAVLQESPDLTAAAHKAKGRCLILPCH